MCMDILMVLTKVYRDRHGKLTTNTQQYIQHPDTTDNTRSKLRTIAPSLFFHPFFVFVCLLCVCFCVFVCLCLFVVVFNWCFLCIKTILCKQRSFTRVIIDVHGHSDGANQGISG